MEEIDGTREGYATTAKEITVVNAQMSNFGAPRRFLTIEITVPCLKESKSGEGKSTPKHRQIATGKCVEVLFCLPDEVCGALRTSPLALPRRVKEATAFCVSRLELEWFVVEKSNGSGSD